MTKLTIILMVWSFLLVGAIISISLTQRSSAFFGDRCVGYVNEDAVIYLNQTEIDSFSYNLQCNTFYVEILVKPEIEKEQSIALLVRISSYYYQINYPINVQVALGGNEYIIHASFTLDGGVSLTITNL